MKKAIGVLSVFLSVMLISYSIFGWVWAANYSWTTTKVYPNTATSAETGATALDYDSSGVAHIISIDDNDDGHYGLIYSKNEGAGGNCDAIGDTTGSDDWNCRTINTAAIGGDESVHNVGMQIDSSDNIHVVYVDSSSDLYYTTCDDSTDTCDTVGTWDAPIKVATNAANPDLEQIAGYPNIVYHDTVQDDIVLAEYYGGGGDCNAAPRNGSALWECHDINTTDDVVGNPAISQGNNGNNYHMIYSVNDDSGTNICGASSSCVVHASSANSFSSTLLDNTGAATGHDIEKRPLTGGAGENNLTNDMVIFAYSISNNIYYALGTGAYAQGSYSTTQVAQGGDIPSIHADYTTSSYNDVFISFGNPTSGTTMAKLYIAEKLEFGGGDCDSVLSGSDGWNCHVATTDAGNYNHTHTSLHLSDPSATMGTDGGLFFTQGAEQAPAAVPEFGSKLAAVMIGASALGLFGLIVLFRGRKPKGKKK